MKLALGTAQMGLNYGAFNESGRITPQESARIFSAGAKFGIKTLDTAAAYGSSESVIGENFQQLQDWEIITKLAPLNGLTDKERIKRLVVESLNRLNRQAIYGLMLHRAEDLLGPGGEDAWSALEDQKNLGRIQKLGVSVYSTEDALAIVKMFPIKLVQIPLNLIDNRPLLLGNLKKLKQEGVEIHVRSVFLQGLLISDFSSLNPFFDPLKSHLLKIEKKIRLSGQSPLQACLAFAKSISEVDRIVVGVDSVRHLEEIVSAYSLAKNIWDESFAWTGSEDFLNPGKWKMAGK